MCYKMVKKKENFPHILKARISEKDKIELEFEMQERQYNNLSLTVRQIIKEWKTVKAIRKKAIREIQKSIIAWNVQPHEVVFKNEK